MTTTTPDNQLRQEVYRKWMALTVPDTVNSALPNLENLDSNALREILLCEGQRLLDDAKGA